MKTTGILVSQNVNLKQECCVVKRMARIVIAQHEGHHIRKCSLIFLCDPHFTISTIALNADIYLGLLLLSVSNVTIISEICVFLIRYWRILATFCPTDVGQDAVAETRNPWISPGAHCMVMKPIYISSMKYHTLYKLNICCHVREQCDY